MTIIVSVGERGEIGRGGDLCWHIPADLKRFKSLTMGGAVIMGRKTWESLPRKPLPGRLNIVVSSSMRPDGEEAGGAEWVGSIEEALHKAQNHKAFIIGGETLYRQAMPLADRLEITRILDEDAEADRFFPETSEEDWLLTETSGTMETEGGLRYRYETYARRTENS